MFQTNGRSSFTSVTSWDNTDHEQRVLLYLLPELKKTWYDFGAKGHSFVLSPKITLISYLVCCTLFIHYSFITGIYIAPLSSPPSRGAAQRRSLAQQRT